MKFWILNLLKTRVYIGDFLLDFYKIVPLKYKLLNRADAKGLGKNTTGLGIIISTLAYPFTLP